MRREICDSLKGQLDTLPSKPGCYLYKDADGKVIYVGKAINLRNRVRSYFHDSAQHGRRIDKLVQHICDIEWIVVGSELEALILEMNLIKKHRPHYNVRLKDDKRYPYIKVHWANPFPTVTVTRQMEQDGSRYFGPYTSVWAVHQTLDLLRRIFPYLTCDREITGQDERACLYFDIKLCCAPCTGKIDQTGYRQMIADLCEFLDGRTESVVTRLQTAMEQAAEELRFEQAAALRDQIRGIETVVEKQKIISTEYLDSDVLALARSDGDACVQVFFIRGGKLIGRDYFLLEGAADSSDAGVMTEFIKQFYNNAPTVPAQVLLPQEVEEAQIIRTWLSSRRDDHKIEILVPRQGPQHELIEMAAENAAETLHALQTQWQADRHKQEQALGELQSALGLDQPAEPHRMLRHLEYPGHRGGGQHGGLRAGRGEESLLPALQHPQRQRSGRFCQHGRGADAALQPLESRPGSGPDARQEAGPVFRPTAGFPDRGWRQRPAGQGGGGAGEIRAEWENPAGRAGEAK